MRAKGGRPVGQRGRWWALAMALALWLGVAGCGQLFTVGNKVSSSEDLAQRVDNLEAQVSELQTAVASLGSANASTSSGSQAVAPSKAAPSHPKAVVRADFLNVRQQPDTHALRVGVLRHNTEVDVLATDGDWTKIEFNRLSGWVESKYLQKEGS